VELEEKRSKLHSRSLTGGKTTRQGWMLDTATLIPCTHYRYWTDATITGTRWLVTRCNDSDGTCVLTSTVSDGNRNVKGLLERQGTRQSDSREHVFARSFQTRHSFTKTNTNSNNTNSCQTQFRGEHEERALATMRLVVVIESTILPSHLSINSICCVHHHFEAEYYGHS